jgi:hypothetical protein
LPGQAGAAWLVAGLQPESVQPAATGDPESPPAVDERAVIGGSAWDGFRAVFRSPYLLGISACVLILAILATFIHSTRLQMVAALGEGLDLRTAAFAVPLAVIWAGLGVWLGRSQATRFRLQPEPPRGRETAALVS